MGCTGIAPTGARDVKEEILLRYNGNGSVDGRAHRLICPHVTEHIDRQAGVSCKCIGLDNWGTGRLVIDDLYLCLHIVGISQGQVFGITTCGIPLRQVPACKGGATAHGCRATQDCSIEIRREEILTFSYNGQTGGEYSRVEAPFRDAIDIDLDTTQSRHTHFLRNYLAIDGQVMYLHIR